MAKLGTVIQFSLQRLQCSACGAEANASCNCGQPYVPASTRVAEYDQGNPGQSTRTAAGDLGISHESVRRARAVNHVTPGTVTGRDGKQYPARQSQPESADEHRNNLQHIRSALVIQAAQAKDLAIMFRRALQESPRASSSESITAATEAAEAWKSVVEILTGGK